MDDGSAERFDVGERLLEIVHSEVGQRERVPWTASARMNAKLRWLRACLPSVALSLSPGLECQTEQFRPEAAGAHGVVGRELDEGKQRDGHGKV
jgi:hypothetical protein